MLILGIESTCDETGSAIVRDGCQVLSNVVATQADLHAKYRGVVPEIASRAHIENILPVINESIEKAGSTLADIDAIAIAHRPGLIGSLLIGVTAAKTLAWSLGKPLIGVDHVHAHLYSVMLNPQPNEAVIKGRDPFMSSGAVIKGSRPFMTAELQKESGIDRAGSDPALDVGAIVAMETVPFPSLGLVVSGGHTAMYDVRSWTQIQLIGSTIDDAVGEAYDKVAAILGLGYPGGPIVDRLAQDGNPKAVTFPRSMLGRESLDFSFSGLKTAVLYHVRGVPGRDLKPANMNEQHVKDISASFQAACVDTIVRKLRRGLERTGARSIIVGGGVSANRGLREALKRFDVPVFFPPMEFCTDNAAMSAGLAHVLMEEGLTSALDLDAITYSQFRI